MKLPSFPVFPLATVGHGRHVTCVFNWNKLQYIASNCYLDAVFLPKPFEFSTLAARASDAGCVCTLCYIHLCCVLCVSTADGGMAHLGFAVKIEHKQLS